MEGRLVPGQDNIVEIDTRGAGNVDLVDQLESGNAQCPPRQVCFISNRWSNWEEYELNPYRCPRVDGSRDKNIDIVEPAMCRAGENTNGVSGHA